MPPRKIWHDGDKLEAHFNAIKAKWSGNKDEEFKEGSWEEAESGESVTLRNRFADYVRVNQKLDLDDFSEI